MDWLTEPFQYEFMHRALVAGVLAAVTASLIGTWVVIRGLSFIGDALAHGVLPGIAIAFVRGWDITIGALLSAVAMVAGVSVVSRRGRLSEDTSIGLLFVGMLALGVVIISRSASYTGDLTAFLFGNPLATTGGDLVLQAAVAALVASCSVLLFRPFLVLAFNEDKARSLGLHPALAQFALLGLLAVAVVASFRTVGSLLVFGLLIAPPATASLLVRRVRAMMALSVALAVASVSLGLTASYHWDTAPGATMAGAAVGLFFVVLGAREAAAVATRTRNRPA